MLNTTTCSSPAHLEVNTLVVLSLAVLTLLYWQIIISFSGSDYLVQLFVQCCSTTICFEPRRYE